MSESQVVNTVNDILIVVGIEQAFSCFIVDRPDLQAENIKHFQNELTTAFGAMAPDILEAALKQYLIMAANLTNTSWLKLLIDTLDILVSSGTLQSRLVCECILACDKLIYTNQYFWVQCFTLMRKIIGGVDYKGVREIMKGCREKAQTLPSTLDSSSLPQWNALETVISYIFNRNACLLPGYFIVNEIQKAYPDPDNQKWPHWKMAGLLSAFVESFRPTAQMVSIIGHSQMSPVVEHTGYADHLINPWRLDATTLKFSLKGNLPYDPDLLKPQTDLLRYVLEQPYSRDMVCSILGLQKQHKQRCIALEEQLVALVILAMERSEQEGSDSVSDDKSTHWLWLHLSSQLIYFVLFQFANFSNIVTSLHDKLSVRDLRKGRDHLMWVLLQFISGSIQRNPLSNFLPVCKLFDLLYTEKEPLIVPDVSNPICTHQMASTCIWIHLQKKAQTEHTTCHRPIPHSLKAHYEYLQHLVKPSSNVALTLGSDYRIALLCNAFSTNQEYFSRPMATLVETILGNQKLVNPIPPPPMPVTPLSMNILDSLTVHSKMSLIHSIVTHVIKLAQSKTSMSNPGNMAPALVETYSRLLVYTEIESLGIKGFIGQLLPTVFKSQAWGILFTLLEMFSYRMHHIQPHYRVQLLSNLHSLTAVPQTNQTQLYLCVESTALRLISGLGNAEVQPQLSRFLSEPKTVVSAESEELNRALILTLARSMHVTGTGADNISGAWCKELLNTIMQNTPHAWANHTLQYFPPVLFEFFTQHRVPTEHRHVLKKAVDEEFRNWTSMSNENDMIAHFSVASTPPLFLCLVWRMILDTDRISLVVYKILERIGARCVSAHLRKFCDYLVFEFTSSGGGQQVNKCIDTINELIWKYNIITIDRLLLCLILRPQEGAEAQVCFFIIQLLLLKAPDFRNRVSTFFNENSPEHWKHANWHEKHLIFQRTYPEKFALEESGPSGSYAPLPIYFGNVCLRFIPVFDILVHRFLEVHAVTKSLEILLEHLGCLYKFHDRPVTFLYNTLHFYERILRGQPALKKKLVAAIIGSLKDIRPSHWALTEVYQQQMFAKPENEAVLWVPGLGYYVALVRRLVETMEGRNHFSGIDWRFNEFPNASAHALYITCVEIMGLAPAAHTVAVNLLDVIAKGYTLIPQNKIHNWINCIGLIISNLPDSYWMVLHDRLIEVMSSHEMVSWKYNCSPFTMYNFNIVHEGMLENKFCMTLAIAHAIWHHGSVGQLAAVPAFIKDKLSLSIQTEQQLLFVCHLIGPFLQRYNTERPRAVMELTSTLYELLEKVDKAQPNLQYMDPICDLLYHIKYMFVGDMMKTEVEGIIRRLRPALQMRLRFIAHLNVEEINAP